MSINYTQSHVNSKHDQTIKGDLKISTNFTQIWDISAFQRILLKADGTVTAMLEAYLSEPIQVVKLSERLAKIELELPNIISDKEEEVISRKVLLQGKFSRHNFIYADSVILINNLNKQISHELLNTKKPIGKIWAEQRVETFKEIIISGKELANELSHYFYIEPKDNLLFRTYSVSSQGKIIMIITEKFPESCYFSRQVSLASQDGTSQS